MIYSKKFSTLVQEGISLPYSLCTNFEVYGTLQSPLHGIDLTFRVCMRKNRTNTLISIYLSVDNQRNEKQALAPEGKTNRLTSVARACRTRIANLTG